MAAWLILGFYGALAAIGMANLFLMRRPLLAPGEPLPLVLIPARNEEENLPELIRALTSSDPSVKVIVFDDDSSDGTSLVANQFGAQVLTAEEPLPAGWTGKNRACYLLAQAAANTDAEWWLFLDADVRPQHHFLASIQWLCQNAPPSVGLVTGFPRVLPGQGVEPLFLAWVGWVLLTTNPYGIISRTGLGHSRFKNGQVHCWRREVYTALQPNLQVRSQIMEDVMIGRMLAREGVKIEVANLSRCLSVRMYSKWNEALDGMSKNSYEITGNVPGSVAVAAFFIFAGWGWLLAGRLMLPALFLFVLSGVSVCLTCRTVWWPLLLAPLIPTVGALTVVRSIFWHRKGTVRWKGRTYSHTQKEAARKSGLSG